MKDSYRLWFCCGRGLRSDFCPNCGSKKSIDPGPTSVDQNTIKKAYDILAILEKSEMQARNSADTYSKKLSEYNEMLEKSEQGTEEEFFLSAKACSLRDMVNGQNSRGDKFCGLKNAMKALITMAENHNR